MTKRREKSKPQPAALNKQQQTGEVGLMKDEKNELAITFGKFCLDLAKLTYGGVFLSAIMQLSYDMGNAVRYGAVAIVLPVILGMLFVKIGNDK